MPLVSDPAVKVELAQQAPEGWDAYVRAHPQASPYHAAAAVQIANKVFGFECHYLLARGAPGNVRGVLPLVEQPGLVRGRRLVSLPFFNYGGIVADDDEAAVALARRAEQLATECRVSELELRHGVLHSSLPYPVSLEKATLERALPATSELLWKSFDSKLRSQIRRAEREKPVVEFGGADQLERFYAVFCSVMRDLGTPVYPRKFFEYVLEWAGDNATIAIIQHAGAPVAGAFLIRSGDTIEIPWAGTLSRVKGLAMNMRLYWEVLQYAIARECKTFDFGRSTVDSGPYRFKRQWGATPRQLHWQHWRAGGEARAPARQSDSMGLAVKAWQKLPLPVANWIGPLISPRLPW